MKWTSCPWCKSRIGFFPPFLAGVAGDRVSQLQHCGQCGSRVLLFWDIDLEKILEARCAPEKKLSWEPSFDGPIDSRKRG